MLEAHPELWEGWMPKHGASIMHGVKPRLIGDRPFWEALVDGDYRDGLFLRWVMKDTLDCTPALTAVAEWARETVTSLAALIGAADIGKVTIIRLRAGGKVPPHVDGMGEDVCELCQAAGASACMYFKRYPDRFHCAISSNPDCWFECGGERVNMQPGEVWWFDQKVEHGVTNAGTVDRIHLVLDARMPGAVG